jgi:hypothetical protein
MPAGPTNPLRSTNQRRPGQQANKNGQQTHTPDKMVNIKADEGVNEAKDLSNWSQTLIKDNWPVHL